MLSGEEAAIYSIRWMQLIAQEHPGNPCVTRCVVVAAVDLSGAIVTYYCKS